MQCRDVLRVMLCLLALITLHRCKFLSIQPEVQLIIFIKNDYFFLHSAAGLKAQRHLAQRSCWFCSKLIKPPLVKMGLEWKRKKIFQNLPLFFEFWSSCVVGVEYHACFSVLLHSTKSSTAPHSSLSTSNSTRKPVILLLSCDLQLRCWQVWRTYCGKAPVCTRVKINGQKAFQFLWHDNKHSTAG